MIKWAAVLQTLVHILNLIYERRSSVGGPAYLSFAPKLKTLNPWNRHCGRATRNLSLIEYRVCSQMCWPGGQHLFRCGKPGCWR